MECAEALAPLLSESFGKNESFAALAEKEIFNYLLKCTDGIYEGKFLFINTTPDGELFGSADPEKNDLTMYVQGAGLDQIHAEIKFAPTEVWQLRHLTGISSGFDATKQHKPM